MVFEIRDSPLLGGRLITATEPIPPNTIIFKETSEALHPKVLRTAKEKKWSGIAIAALKSDARIPSPFASENFTKIIIPRMMFATTEMSEDRKRELRQCLVAEGHSDSIEELWAKVNAKVAAGDASASAGFDVKTMAVRLAAMAIAQAGEAPTSAVDDMVWYFCLLRTNGWGVGPKGGTSALFPFTSMACHSCNPNCTAECVKSAGEDDKYVIYLRTSRGVMKGEPLTLSYGPSFLNASVETRRSHLQTTKNFTCECPFCVYPVEKNLLVDDCFGYQDINWSLSAVPVLESLKAELGEAVFNVLTDRPVGENDKLLMTYTAVMKLFGASSVPAMRLGTAWILTFNQCETTLSIVELEFLRMYLSAGTLSPYHGLPVGLVRDTGRTDKDGRHESLLQRVQRMGVTVTGTSDLLHDTDYYKDELAPGTPKLASHPLILWLVAFDAAYGISHSNGTGTAADSALDATGTSTASRGVHDGIIPLPQPPQKKDLPGVNLCWCCAKPGVPAMATCARCGLGRYCGRDCQKAHWRMHKVPCAPPGTVPVFGQHPPEGQP